MTVNEILTRVIMGKEKEVLILGEIKIKITDLPEPLRGRGILEEVEEAGSGFGFTEASSVFIIGLASIIHDLKIRVKKLEERNFIT